MDRAQRVFDRLAARELGGLLVTSPANLYWLTGYSGSNGLAIVGPSRERHFFTDFRYREQVAIELADGWEAHIATDIDAAAAELLEDRQSGRPMRIGFNDEQVPVARVRALGEGAGEQVELIAAGGVIEELRAVKDEGEVAAIRAASELADAALTSVLERGLAGRTEREVALDLEFTMRRAGAQSVSFPPIVASGAHGALPHAQPRDVTIEAGVLVTIDWGALLDGYCSDCTRTYATGELPDEERSVYELVLAAEQAGVAAVSAGASGREVDAIARALIDDAGHGEHFGHGLGHGVGIEIHEAPRLSLRSDDTLAAGMVVTVEPGVYLPGRCGVRIEDLVVVTGDGCEVLTGLPRELQIVS